VPRPPHSFPTRRSSDLGNLVAGQRSPDAPDLFDGADVMVRARVENQRVAVVPLEGNSIAVVPGDDGMGHDLTMYVSTQMPHGFRSEEHTSELQSLAYLV